MYIENSTQTEVTFAYGIDFKFGEEISKTVLKLRENNKIDHLYEKWVFIPQCLSSNVEFSQFDINYFGGIMLICGILLLVSISLIFMENLHTYVKVKRVKNMELQRERSVTVTTNCSADHVASQERLLWEYDKNMVREAKSCDNIMKVWWEKAKLLT